MANKNKTYHCQCETCAKHPRSWMAGKHRAINRLLATLDEKSRRKCVGILALERGRGGISALHRITGMSRQTIRRGQVDVLYPDRLEDSPGVRQLGGGRPTVEKNIRAS